MQENSPLYATTKKKRKMTVSRAETEKIECWKKTNEEEGVRHRASERKYSRGYEGRYRPPNLIEPPHALSGPMPLNHFLSDGSRSSFKSEGITIFPYSEDL